MGLSDNLDALLYKYDISQNALARIAGVSGAAITGWRNGARPRQQAIANICNYFNLNEDDLLSDSYGLAGEKRFLMHTNGSSASGTSENSYAPLHRQPFSVSDNKPVHYETEVPLPIPIKRNHPKGYFLRIESDSMDKLYPLGCLILVDPTIQPHNGSVVIASINGSESLIRKVYTGANNLILSPCSFNSEHKDIIIPYDTPHDVDYYGVVVWFQAAEEGR